MTEQYFLSWETWLLISIFCLIVLLAILSSRIVKLEKTLNGLRLDINWLSLQIRDRMPNSVIQSGMDEQPRRIRTQAQRELASKQKKEWWARKKAQADASND